MRSKVALLVAGWIAASSASVVAAEDLTYDPKPAADDMVLPMPGGLEMHFRRVDVPGGDFWYDPDGTIVKVEFPITDGSEVTLLLR